jgi:hypothetical protein
MTMGRADARCTVSHGAAIAPLTRPETSSACPRYQIPEMKQTQHTTAPSTITAGSPFALCLLVNKAG